MKKIFLMLAVTFILATSFNVCNAEYVYVTTNKGNIYLDTSSVKVVDPNPPYYYIGGHFINHDGNKVVNSFDVVLGYNWDTKETFSWQNGSWQRFNTYGESTGPRMNRKIADALFKIAYGQNFYGY